MIKAIIFDWFGVCTEEFTKPLSRAFKQEFGKNKKFVIESYKKYELALILRKTSTKNVLKIMFQDLNIDKDADAYLYIFDSMTNINNRIFQLIKKLKNNYRIVLLSDNFDEMTKTIRRYLDLNEYFNVTIFSNEVGLVKREIRIYKFVINKLKLKANECIFIDDKKENINRGKKLGINGILFLNIIQLK